jgi:glycosyl transferase family 25
VKFTAVNNYFDKIYVITLKRATDRHLHVQQHLQGLDYALWYGADKMELDIDQLIKDGLYSPALSKKHHDQKKQMHPGEIGCALSHFAIYQDVVDHQYKKVLILEDDAVVDEQQFFLFEEMASELPQNWQLWYLGFNKNEKSPAMAPFKEPFYHACYALGIKRTYNHQVIGNRYARPYAQHLLRAGFHDCTHAYAITTSAAAVLLKMQTPLQYLADNLLAFAAASGQLQAFASWPRLINQPFQNGQSIISYLYE